MKLRKINHLTLNVLFVLCLSWALLSPTISQEIVIGPELSTLSLYGPSTNPNSNRFLHWEQPVAISDTFFYKHMAECGFTFTWDNTIPGLFENANIHHGEALGAFGLKAYLMPMSVEVDNNWFHVCQAWKSETTPHKDTLIGEIPIWHQDFFGRPTGNDSLNHGCGSSGRCEDILGDPLEDQPVYEGCRIEDGFIIGKHHDNPGAADTVLWQEWTDVRKYFSFFVGD